MSLKVIIFVLLSLSLFAGCTYYYKNRNKYSSRIKQKSWRSMWMYL